MEKHCRPKRLFHVSVMPCHEKKLEAARPDFVDVSERISFRIGTEFGK